MASNLPLRLVEARQEQVHTDGIQTMRRVDDLARQNGVGEIVVGTILKEIYAIFGYAIVCGSPNTPVSSFDSIGLCANGECDRRLTVMKVADLYAIQIANEDSK